MREDAFRLLKGEKPGFLKDLVGHDLTGLESRVSLAAKLFTIVEKATRALLMAQEGERRAHGFDYKQQQEKTAEDEAALSRRREMAVSIIGRLEELRRKADAYDEMVKTTNASEHGPTISGLL
ncbi:hypothetical protein [Microvirga sp. P5_D2]